MSLGIIMGNNISICLRFKTCPNCESNKKIPLLAGFNFLLPTKPYPNDYLEVRGFTSWVTILSKAVCRAGPESTERSSTGSREPSQRSSTATLTTTGSLSTTTRRGSPLTPPSWPPAGRPTPTGTQSSESTLWLQIK